MDDKTRKGKAHRLLDRMPPEIRARIEAALNGEKASSLETSKITVRSVLGSNEPAKIEINGQSYASIDEVPAEYRDQVARLMNVQPVSTSATNGRASLDQVPPELRELMQKAWGKGPSFGAASSAGERAPSVVPSRADRVDRFSGSPERSRGSFLWILLGLAAIAAGAYLTLRR
jgi:hypothetical protein